MTQNPKMSLLHTLITHVFRRKQSNVVSTEDVIDFVASCRAVRLRSRVETSKGLAPSQENP
jgi:hypothetical protein